jgi:hypothetical protein
MEFRKLLCHTCKDKIRKAEAKYKQQRRKLKIKGRLPQVSGKVEINKNI